MNAAIGFFSLIAVMASSLLNLWLAWKDTSAQKALRCQYLTLGFCVLSFVVLLLCFATSDFSVELVARHSALAKPMLYKLTGSWGNHEGSMLLWLLVLAVYGAAFAWVNRRGEASAVVLRYAAGCQGFLVAGITAFILFTSNPFETLWPVPPDGAGLNPVLQDIGLAIHPPVLYAGYVGFSLVFSLAVAALMARRFSTQDAKHMRFWALLAWGWLSAGIGLGSWWAYRELGWGGWWFWDPVENASLLPWLSGGALCHVLAASQKRGLYLRWVLLLALMTFSLSLLGTFLVRSGILTSVHSFANDPARGMFILGFLTFLTGGGLILFGLRQWPVKAVAGFTLASRESWLAIQSLLLATACFTVALGTLYPLMIQLTGQRAVSVGPAYFNTLFLPLALLALPLAGLAISARWQKETFRSLLKARYLPLVSAGIITAVIAFLFPVRGVSLCLTAAAAACLCLTAQTAWQVRGQRSMAMPGVLAHAGFGLLVVGIIGSGFFSPSRDAVLLPGESMKMEGYEVRYLRYEEIAGPDYLALKTWLRVMDAAGNEKATLTPEKRYYPVQNSTTLEASRRWHEWGEFYAAIGDTDKEGRIGLRFHVQRLIQAVWLGFALMALSGFWAAFTVGITRKKR